MTLILDPITGRPQPDRAARLCKRIISENFESGALPAAWTQETTGSGLNSVLTFADASTAVGGVTMTTDAVSGRRCRITGPGIDTTKIAALRLRVTIAGGKTSTKSVEFAMQSDAGTAGIKIRHLNTETSAQIGRITSSISYLDTWYAWDDTGWSTTKARHDLSLWMTPNDNYAALGTGEGQLETWSGANYDDGVCKPVITVTAGSAAAQFIVVYQVLLDVWYD